MGARFRGRSSADRPANFICASAGRRQEPTSKMVQLPENTVQGTRAISESVMYFGLRRFLARDMSSATRVPDPQPFSVSAVAFKLQASRSMTALLPVIFLEVLYLPPCSGQ